MRINIIFIVGGTWPGARPWIRYCKFNSLRKRWWEKNRLEGKNKKGGKQMMKGRDEWIRDKVTCVFYIAYCWSQKLIINQSEVQRARNKFIETLPFLGDEHQNCRKSLYRWAKACPRITGLAQLLFWVMTIGMSNVASEIEKLRTSVLNVTEGSSGQFK